MSVLHIVDPGEPGSGAATLRFVADLMLESGDAAGKQSRVGNRHSRAGGNPGKRESASDCLIVFGHRGHARLAQRCGLRVDGLLPFPRALRRRGSSGFRNLISALERVHGRFELVHAWSLRAGRLARTCLPNRPCVVSAMVGPASMPLLERLASAQAAAIEQDAPLRLLAANDSVAAELLRAGADPDVVRIVTPGVDASLLAPHRQLPREMLRTQWGVDDETLLVGLIAQPIEWGNARAAASIVTLPVTANRDVKLLVHPNAMRLREAYEWARPLDLDRRFVQEPELAQPWQLFAGLDVALWLGNLHTAFDGEHPALMPHARQPTPSALPILWAFAAGVPVLAERCAATAALIRHGENGMLFDPHDVPAGARYVIELFDDSELRRALGEAGRRDAEARFTMVRAAQRVRDVYAELLGDSRRDTRQVASAVRSPSSASAART